MLGILIGIMDIALFIILIRLVIQIQKPLPPAIIFAAWRLIFIPSSNYTTLFTLSAVIFGVAFLFAICYLYFWLLVRIQLGTLPWWLVMLSLPMIRVLLLFPWGLLRVARAV